MSSFHLRHIVSRAAALALGVSLLGAVAGCSSADAPAAADDAGVSAEAGDLAADAGARPPGRPGPAADAGPGGPVATFTVGGTVSGLIGKGLVLTDNGGDALTLDADGRFTFARPIADGGTFAVFVQKLPSNPTEICSVANGDGTIAGANVTNVEVHCSVAGIPVGGTVVGLAGSGLVLQDNAGDDLPIGKNGAFAFAQPIASGAPYAVTVKTQPTAPTQTCSVSGGTGVAGGGPITSVVVNCGTNTYTVGGTVSGLTGTLVLQDNGGDDLTVSANGSFAFPQPLASGAAYAVTIKSSVTSPVEQCVVTAGTGAVTSANVTSVSIQCTVQTFTVGGTVSGSPDLAILQNNGGDDLELNNTGAFTFATRVPSGGAYNVTLKREGVGNRHCYIANGSGVVTNANITNVVVKCPESNTWATVAPMPTARTQAAAALGTDGRMYVMGGVTNAFLSVVEAYSPSTNTWSTAPSMPNARSWFTAVAAADGYIYAVGGGDANGPVARVDAYSPVTSTWKAVADFPEPHRNMLATRGADGRVYAYGTTSMFVYDAASNTWLYVGPTGEISSAFPAGIATGADGRIWMSGYVSTGFTGHDAFDVFSPSAGSWTNTVATDFGPLLTGEFGYIHRFGASHTVFNPASGTSSTAPNMNQPRGYFAAALNTDFRIYTFGGTDASNNPTSTVEVYTP